ncbi:alpha/beta hydrolase family protein [Stackebrandtia albiflava]|uniref:Alpha/beta hydrolase family protein n=1 Tax=Stackebrandtia albiflava TaxID=406432 RepID=A0A562UQ55_9ACTN|nr:alpha/beta hydrolase [Stackebrandtia albiflava]TWJ07736.1 alpha/beta hydrolase family protein [Stackebrandtia albiflava]
MVGYIDLIRVDVSSFTESAAAYEALAGDLNDQADAIKSHADLLSDAWTGDQVGGVAATTLLRRKAEDAAAAADDMVAIAETLTDLADTVTRSKAALKKAAADAVELGGRVVISGVGEVHEAFTGNGHLDRMDVGKQVDAIRKAIDDAITKATEADETARFSLLAAQPPYTVIPVGTPATIAGEWWKEMTDAEREWMMRNRPEVIGKLDGVPADIRDRVNRRLLDAEIARLEKLADEEWFSSDTEEQLAALKAMRDAGGDGGPRAYILLFDTEGDGRAIVSFGNPDTADNVVTYVPGMNTALGDFDGPDGHLDRARILADQSAEVDGKDTTASIVWFDYDAPEWGEAVSQYSAEEGSEKLHNFQEGLRVTHEGPESTNTVLGYSYGSTMVGVTAREHGLDTDKVIFFGSPGTGVDVATDLKIDGDGDGKPDDHTIYSTEASNDTWITRYGPHGNRPFDPDGDGDFGGKSFTSRPEGHTGYFLPSQMNDPNGAITNAVKILTGKGTMTTPSEANGY